MKGRGISTRAVSLVLALVFMSMVHGHLAYADNFVPPNEVQARHLDEQALQAKRIALKSFSGILPRYHNTPQEPVFLLRQAEMLHDIAAIQYRLIFGKNGQPESAETLKDKSDKKVDLSEYQKTMKDSLTPLNQIVVTTPKFQKMPHVIRMRAKAYRELGSLEEALHDLKYFVETWPTHSEAPLAYSDLWAILMQKKYYGEAIQYINRYGLRVNDKYYHSAIENLAWCNYFLGSVSQSILYTETELKTAKGMDRDKAVSNLALFYSTGIEKKDPTTPADQALTRFKNSVSGEDLEKVSISYAYLLRSKALDDALEQFKSAGYLDSALPDTGRSDLLILTSENELNRQKYAQMKVTIGQELDLITKNPAMKKNAKVMAKAKGSLASSTQALQAALALPNQTMNSEVASILGDCYQFLLDVSQGNPLEEAKLHYNIAEASLIAKDRDEATRHLRWIVDNLSVKIAEQKELYIQASIKALEVRYQLILDKGWRPNELSAKNIDSTSKELPALVNEWIGWVDQFPVAAVTHEVIFDKKFDAFLFESNRILYAFGWVSKSVQRLRQFVDTYPTSKSAIPSAALVIDTYVRSQMWNEAYLTAGKFATVGAWKGTEFSKKLGNVIADAYYKILNSSYNAKDYAGTLKNADDFLQKNPGNRRQADFLELAANASLGLGDKTKASTYFHQLARLGGEKKEVAALSLMTEGSIAEDRLDFGSASDSYRRLLELGGPSDAASADFRNKTLLFAWLSGDSSRLDAVLASKSVCSGNGHIVCKEYADRKSHNSQVAMAIYRLKNEKHLSFKTDGELIKIISSEWSKQNPHDQQVLITDLAEEMPQVLQEMRVAVRKSAKVTLDQAAIQRRVKWLEQLQKVSEKIASLPLVKAQVIAQLEMAGAYQDMIQDLRSIEKPSGISAGDLKELENLLSKAAEPFVKKRDELRLAALSRVQEAGIDAQTADLVFSTFKEDSPLKDERNGKETTEQASAFETGLTSVLSTPSTDNGKVLLKVFQSSMQQSNRPQAGFLIEMAAQHHLLTESDLSLMRAALMAKSGLIPEATSELRAHLSVFDSKTKEKAIAAIWTAYSSLGASDVVAKEFDSSGKLASIAQHNLSARVPAGEKRGTP